VAAPPGSWVQHRGQELPAQAAVETKEGIVQRLVAFAVILMLAPAVLAEAPQKFLAADHLGIFTAPDASGRAHVSTTMPFEPVEVYLVLINPSATAGVSHWECRINFLRYNVSAVQVTLAAGIDLETSNPWDFCVDIGTVNPLPAAEFVHLLTISLLVDKPEGDPVFFYLDASSCNSMQLNMPCYAAGDDPQQWHYLVPTSQAKWFPVFAINSTVLPARVTTWGQFKALCR
jgi:hypothetical protein